MIVHSFSSLLQSHTLSFVLTRSSLCIPHPSFQNPRVASLSPFLPVADSAAAAATMSSKQSRIRRYPSYGDTSLLPPSADSPNGWRKKRYVLPFSAISEAVERKPVPSRPSILTLSSPVKESADATDSEPIGNFLENCYYCKKKIAENGEIFMYSYLRAFCTAECRYSQIAKDIETKRTSGELKDLALQNEEY